MLYITNVFFIFFLKKGEEDQAAEEEEAEGEGVAEIKAELSTKAKRRNLIVTMKMTVSLTPFEIHYFDIQYFF